jgi:hypothetical protein
MNALARLFLFGSLPVVFLAAGCQSQGEGDRCRDNSDCQTDLICFTLNMSQGIAVCCPPVVTSSTNPLCNGSFVIDAGVPPTPAADADAEASTEEAAVEAGADASEDISVDSGTD